MHSSFLSRAQSRQNNFVDHVTDGTSQLNSVRSLDEVSQGGTDVRCLGAPKRVNLGSRSAGFGATFTPSVARLGASVPSAKSSGSVFQTGEMACAPVVGQKMGLDATSSSSSSSSSGPQVPYVMYIDGVPDLNPYLHFRTSLDVQGIMEAVENVFEEFQSTAYEWNRKNCMWRAFVTKSSCPTKCSVHVFKDPCSDAPMYWIEMRRLEGDGQDFFDLFERMQRSLAPDSMLVSESPALSGVMQAPSSGLQRTNTGSNIKGLDKEKKAIFQRVLELTKSKHILQRRHALQLICDTARQDSAACLINLCELGCAEVCLSELCVDVCNINTQLAITALHSLTRIPHGADCVLTAKDECPVLLKLAVDQDYDRMQIARDSALVVNNLLHRSADRVKELFGSPLQKWLDAKVFDHTLQMHVSNCAGLCGIADALDMDTTSTVPTARVTG